VLELSETLQPACPAATVVLLRDSEFGLEALLVQRSKAVAHMGGMWVFPGGRVDDSDYPPDRDEYCAALNAAVRETREEVGVDIAAGQLACLSHWTTPEGARRRFSTWFFLATIPDGQVVTVDGGEIAGHRWVRPETAFAEIADREHPFRLMPPTFVSLVDIAAYASCREACESVAAREVFKFEPRMVFVEDGVCFLYHGDAGYASGDLDAAGSRHRTYMIDGQLEYIRQC